MHTGTWVNQINYYTGFESFKNINSSSVVEIVDGISFNLVNVVAGTQSSDKKEDFTSARISNSGTIETTNFYKGLKNSSFKLGMSSAGQVNGGYSFSVEISNNGTSWTNILNVSRPTSNLTTYNATISAGLTLSDGSVMNETTTLKLRISTFGGNANGNRIFNIDDLAFSYII